MRIKVIMLTLMTVFVLSACGKETQDINNKEVEIETSITESEESMEEVNHEDDLVTEDSSEIPNDSEYYTNDQGDLVDKVEEFETETFNDYTIKYPILDDGVDEVVVYEFDTYGGDHVILDATNVHQQTTMEAGDYGDVELELIAPGRDIAYMYDGERIYIEDHARNLITISKEIVINEN